MINMPWITASGVVGRCLRQGGTALVLVLLLCLASVEGSGGRRCPDERGFQRWLLEFQRHCKLANSTNSTETRCSWVSCPCLEVALQVPVSMDDVASCYEQGSVPEVQRQMLQELMRSTSCGERMREMGEPCGECDRYAMDRGYCFNGTLPPIRVFYAIDPSEGARAIPSYAQLAGALFMAVALILPPSSFEVH
eukprot:TRINITY_DN33641_c0_g1_i1.p1 TRINITY_DN33641_c0_g1~~TRINITY_DN33641_c0_g1_i1.p1  ORF type:complete len:194 (-),score=13.97 TRINITY_DN33641_c0_g1_i1:144-725(-)